MGIFRRLLWIACLAALCSCTQTAKTIPPSQWKRVESPGFTLYVPPGFTEIATQGTDSVVRRFNGEGIALSLDYGWYSDPLNYSDHPGFVENTETINGWRARMVSFDGPATPASSDRVVAVHFSDTGRDRVTLTVYVTCQSDTACDLARRIFRTVDFAERRP
ncbi:MAG: hypothetical protein ABI411_18920 [Tahibacter sp.]